jgi:predicted AlkP superfamily pyrophosphatase or phosphodiesterase
MSLRGLLFAACLLLTPGRAAEPLVILVSLDGFRCDYLEKYAAESPQLRALATEGVRAERMISCYPSSTFANHYSIATGLRPEHHGIVENHFFDPALGAAFVYKRQACAIDGRWWGGEPIWLTAERQGRRAACMFWPGSEATIGGRTPSYNRAFNGALTCAERVDGLLAWLDLPPGERPVFCTLYFDVVDHAGHDFGPDAPETAAAVRDVDTAIRRLLDGLTARGRRADTNLVVISDHGMTARLPDSTLVLDNWLDLSVVQVDFTGTQVGLRPLRGTADQLLERVRESAPAHVRAYRREELPERLHYAGNPRIPPVLLLADEGWEIATRAEVAAHEHPQRGAHGYDPELPRMGATFVAAGPAFRHGVVLPAFENIQIYDLLCVLIGVAPAPNDGDGRLVRDALTGQPTHPAH